jgi:hypothetical protein
MNRLAVAFACLVCLLLASVSHAQEWIDVWGLGDPYNHAAADIVICQDGGVVVAGRTTILTLVKYTPAGAHAWSKRFALSYVTGGEYGSPRLAPTSDGGVVVSSMGWHVPGQSMLVVACNASGDSLWEWHHQWNTDATGHVTDVAVDGNGDIVVVGAASDTSSQNHIGIARLTSMGQESWLSVYNGPRPSDDVANGVALDNTGAAYVACDVRNTLAKRKPTLLKYGTNGALQWVRMFGQEAYHDGYYTAVAVTPSGYVYAAGVGSEMGLGPLAKYTLSGDSVWNIYTGGDIHDMCVDSTGNIYAVGSSPSGDDYSTWKYSPAGALIWNRTYDGPEHGTDIALSVAVDHSGNVLVTGGSTDSTITQDWATVKYNAVGVQQWVARYRYNTLAEAYDVAVDAAENVYTTGYVNDSTYNHQLWVVAKYPSSGPAISEQGDVAFTSALRVSPTVTRAGCRVFVAGSTSEVIVMDAAGRTVRTLVAQLGSGGEFVWDGCGADGLFVPDGVYFVVAETERGRSATKVVVQH